MLLVMTVSVFERSQAAVDLLYFSGYGEDAGVYLEWETATEIDTSGFYVRRSASENGTYTRLPASSPQFISATGDSLTGDYYYIVDQDVVDGTGYWYQLEIIDTNSQSTLINPPIQVVAGVFATEPSSQTGTATSTATTASRGSNPTPIVNPTSTFVPTRTRTPPVLPYPIATQPLANTPTQPVVPELTPTESITATATLIPLPELTLQFPTEVPAVGSSSLKSDLEQPEAETGSKRPVWFTFEKLIFLGFILLIWVILGGWFYLSYRRLE